MEIKEFKRLLKRTQKRLRFLGFGFFLLGGVITAILISNFEGLHWEESTLAKVGTIIGFTCGIGVGGFGLFWLIKALIADHKIARGKHRILLAIEDTNQTPVIWFYESLFEHYRYAQRYAELHFTIYLADGERFVLGFDEKDKPNVECMQQFLAQKFPHAEVGYSNQIRAKMCKRFGKRV